MTISISPLFQITSIYISKPQCFVLFFKSCLGQTQLTTRAVSGWLNVERKKGSTEVRNNFWAVRVVDSWNTLPNTIKAATSVNMFKNSLDNLLAGWRI